MRFPHLRDAVFELLAAGGQDFSEHAGFHRRLEHGWNLRWQKMRDFFQRLSETHAAFEIGGEQMKPHAERTVPRLRHRENRALETVALLQTGLEQIEKKPGAFLAPQRQTDEKVERIEQAADRHKANEEPQAAAPEHRVHGPSPPFPPSESSIPTNTRSSG